MPITPQNRARYPKNWAEISKDIRFNRAQNKCEFCGVQNHSHVDKTTRVQVEPTAPNAVKIILTVAHLDHQPENCDYQNLAALCQKCHNNYDKEHRAKSRAETRKAKRINQDQNQLFND